jgi:hypothetical protein
MTGNRLLISLLLKCLPRQAERRRQRAVFFYLFRRLFHRDICRRSTAPRRHRRCIWSRNLPANHPVQTANCFGFGGLAGDVFVSGDWNNTGTSQAGVYRNGLWVLDAASPGAPQTNHVPSFMFGYGGVAGDIPVPGKW